MEISFGSKEDSNDRRREEFLALSPVERFYRFIDNMERSAILPTKKEVINASKKDNFLIVLEHRGEDD